jgi:hypothetical protein
LVGEDEVGELAYKAAMNDFSREIIRASSLDCGKEGKMCVVKYLTASLSAAEKTSEKRKISAQ